MFTGLIAAVGRLEGVRRDEQGAELEIQSEIAASLRDGDSVAVDGVCLTAVEVGAQRFRAQAMNETLARSSLGGLRAGSRVNLELPLRAGDRLGGHVVQGHVDGTATVQGVREEGFARVLELDCEQRLLRYLVLKGSVAVNGVSLTVSALRESGFEVSLIPETLQRTNLGSLREGTRVNVEVDILAKQLERLAEARA